MKGRIIKNLVAQQKEGTSLQSKMWRVDYLIHILLEVETNYFFNYNQRCVLSGFNPKKLREEERHKQGMKIDATLIQVYTMNLYTNTT